MGNISIKTRKIRVEQLRLSSRLSGRLWAEALGVENRLRAPESLTDQAIELIALIHPIHVRDAGDGQFDVVANHVVANLTQRLQRKTQVHVLVWQDSEIVPPQETLFLTYLLFGLSSGQNHTVLRLYELLSSAQKARISPHLRSRSGLERLTGVSRKITIEDRLKPIGKDNQMSLEV